MPQSNSLPATLSGYVKTVSAALDDIDGAHKTLAAREIRVQALMTELTTIVQGSTGTPATLLRIQMAMQRENQVFTSISNVMKTRHDTAKNAIGNIR